MATREELLRDLILSPHGRLTIVRDTADRETRKALTSLIDGAPQRATHAAGMLDLVVHPDDERLDAYTMHNVLAVARNLLLTVTEPTPEADIVARFAPSGFTAAMVRDGVNFLRRDGLATRREGVITVLVAPPATAPNIPTELLLPRTLTAQHAPAARYESAGASTPPVRRNTAIPAASDIGDLDAAPVRRNTASLGTGTPASFEVGDIPEASLNPVIEEASVTEPTAAITLYMGELVDCFARIGKVTASWEEMGFPFPPIAAVPPSVDAAKWRQDILNEATHRLVSKGTLTRDGDTFTYVPARDAVKAVRDKHETYLSRMGESTEVVPADLLLIARMVKDIPMGWNIETLHKLSIAELVAAGTLTPDGTNYRRKPTPKVVDKPAPKPAPAAPVQQTPPAPSSPPKAAPAPAPKAPAAPAINSPALEKKVDNLTNSVERVERKLDTLPPPPSAEKVLMDEADDAVKSLLESVCVRLKVDGALTEGAIHRALPGRSKPSRVNPNPVDKRLRLGEALALGVDARILDFDHVTRKYRLITVTNLMPKTDLERRVKRIKDMREAA